jgi:RimJ/RimL family protein N-acetyltransferase
MEIQPVTLEGRWVRLEPLKIEHVDALWLAGSDPDLWNVTSARIASVDDMKAYVEAALRDPATLPFCTIERETGRVAGTTRFANIVPEHKRAEIGWTFLGKSHQRTPLNTEAKYLMFRHAFETWGFNRVELKTSALNFQSRTAILRVGAMQEGILRRHMVNPDGSARDTVYYSVIADEWPQVKNRLERMLERDYTSSR